MLRIILSPKAIDAFKTKLGDALATVGYNDEDQRKIVDAAADIYSAIARANPLKPLTLPDGGLDVHTTLRSLGGGREAKTRLLKNPDHLFETHRIKIPERNSAQTKPTTTPESPTQTRQRKPRVPRSTPRQKRSPVLPFSVEDVIDAAKGEFDKSGLRPDMTMGQITTGQLSGTKWTKIYNAVQNNGAFMQSEGFTRLSQIFDVAMVGSRHRPCSPDKARKAYCDAFGIAAGAVPSDLFYLKKRHEDSYVRLPYVFRMLADSLLEMQRHSPAPLSTFKAIDKGPLGGMGLDFDTVNDMFFKAKNDYPKFPFNSLGVFIASQNIYQKSKTDGPEQKP